VPAHDDADEISASAFARLLALGGIPARALPLVARHEEIVDLVERAVPVAVCVCSFPPTGLARARHLCRLIRERLPDVPIVVALWGLPGVPDKLHARFAAVGVETLFTRLDEGVPAVARAVRRAPAAEAGAPHAHA
jgi:hypothetical protein